MENCIPVVGAAFFAEELPTYRAWLLSAARDVEIQDPFKPETLDGDWRSLVADIKAMLDGHTGRIGIHGPFQGLDLIAQDPKIRVVIQERLKQGIAFAAELGATHMVIHSPFKFLGSPFMAHSPKHSLPKHLDAIQTTLDPIVPLAAQANCILVIENILDLNPTPVQRVVEAFDSAYVRMSLDTGHAFINHLKGAPPPDHWVDAADTLLEHVHLQDTDGHGDRHWSLGEGGINWTALFKALTKLEHRPRLILELRNKADIWRSYQWLVERELAR